MQKRTRYALASGAALLISVGGIAALSGPAIAEGLSGHAAHAEHTVQSHGSGRSAAAPERSDGDGEHADDQVETDGGAGADHETADDRAARGAGEKTDKAGHNAETADDAAHSSEGAGE